MRYWKQEQLPKPMKKFCVSNNFKMIILEGTSPLFQAIAKHRIQIDQLLIYLLVAVMYE